MVCVGTAIAFAVRCCGFSGYPRYQALAPSATADPRAISCVCCLALGYSKGGSGDFAELHLHAQEHHTHGLSTR